MLSHFDTTTMVIALIALMAIALIFGSVLNAILRENGFGPVGNAVLFAIGCVGGIYLAETYGAGRLDFRLAAAWGLAGAFVLFSASALVKAGMARL